MPRKRYTLRCMADVTKCGPKPTKRQPLQSISKGGATLSIKMIAESKVIIAPKRGQVKIGLQNHRALRLKD